LDAGAQVQPEAVAAAEKKKKKKKKNERGCEQRISVHHYK
jgi:hypothetical protein